MHRNIADMESDGIYFDVNVKEALRKQKEELYCEYSGLPSVKAYEDNKQKNEKSVIRITYVSGSVSVWAETKVFGF